MTRLVSPNVAEAIKGFCDTTAGTVDLRILRVIDVTVDLYCRIQKALKGALTISADLLARVCEQQRDILIDPNEVIIGQLSDVEAQLQEASNILEGAKRLTLNYPDLDGDNKQALVDEISSALDLTHELHDATVELRWAVMEHDANLDDLSGPKFNNADDLIANLKSV